VRVVWYRKDSFSFDFGGRVEAFHDLTDVDAEAQAQALAVRAAEEVRRLRARFPSLGAVASELIHLRKQPGWPRYHAGVAAALTGDYRTATALFEGVATPQADEAPWVGELRRWAAHLCGLLQEPVRFHDEMRVVVRDTRALLKLSEWHGKFMPTIGGRPGKMS
jgi:hypothetical protein